MDNPSRTGNRENPSPLNSPRSNGSPSRGSNNGGHSQAAAPLTPRSQNSGRSEPLNSHPTTFVQADTSNFKQVVQMLTGSSESPRPAPNSRAAAADPPNPKPAVPPIRAGQVKKQGFKLYERRRSLKNGLVISPLISAAVARQALSGFSPRKTPDALSPSALDFPNLALSPVTPLTAAADEYSGSSSCSPEEARAISEKGFYLHPSPMTTVRESEPQLLPLFPVTSPEVSGSSSLIGLGGEPWACDRAQG